MGKTETGGRSGAPQQLSLGVDPLWAPRSAGRCAPAEASAPEPDPPEAVAPPRGRGGVAVLRGCAAAENALFESVEGALEVARAGSSPFRIVVPSSGLRDHLARALVKRRGRAVLGVAIQTHFALALEALERAGAAPRPGRGLGALLCQRLVREVLALRRVAGAYHRGWEGVHATLRDLLDAGFRAPHLEAALECLTETGDGPEQQRVAALLHGAAWSAERQGEARHVETALLLEHATAALAREGSALLPTRGLAIYGIADATGGLADWIEALLLAFRGTLFLNQPTDPAAPEHPERRYSDDFLGRLEARELERVPSKASAAATGSFSLPALVRADTPREEAGEVAARVRDLLDDGVAPEEIAICARRFDDYRSVLIESLDAWAIPYSSAGVSSSGGAATRMAIGVAQFFRDPEALEVDAWVRLDGERSADLRTGLHQLGIARLGDFCGEYGRSEFPSSGDLALGVRQRLDTPRRLSRADWFRARGRARKALAAFREWPERAPAATYREALRLWLRGFVFSDPTSPVAGGALPSVAAGLDSVAAELPAALELTREEWCLWFADRVEATSPPEPGGSGAGVQVLSVMAARERRFTHLFLIGLSRENFPRPIADDPLFPERLRKRLRAVLPDLPLKRRGHEEERHLFASLLESADHVTLSRSAYTATGREWPESPLLLRLRLAHPSLQEIPVRRDGERRSLPVEAAATVAALRADTGALGTLLPHVVRSRRDDASRGAALRAKGRPTARPDRVARGLQALWREFDRPPRGPNEPPLGPFFGWVGDSRNQADPFVTEIADLLRCPWQRFLRRELRIETPPDAGAGLPALDARMRGSAVHRVLERVVEEPGAHEREGRALEDRRVRGARRLVWPEAETLETWMLEAAEETARREGVRGALFPRLLARSLAPALAIARALDETRRVEVLGAEIDGVAELPGAPGRRLRFRADRVEAGATGPVFVEFKSGRAFLDRVRAATRIQQLADTLVRGEGLQVPAYLYAPGASASRLVFLGPAVPSERRETALEPEHEPVLTRFLERTASALDALDRGFRPPRLVSQRGRGEGEACGVCEMRMACLQGDSAQLRRLWDRAGARETGEDRGPLHLLFGAGEPG